LNNLKVIKLETLDKEGKIKFIMAVLEDRLILKNGKKSRPENEIFADMDALGIDRKHIKLNFKSITKEKVARMMAEIEVYKQKVRDLENSTAEDVWMHDLEEFAAEYVKHYKNDLPK
jgi:hypothetical protein